MAKSDDSCHHAKGDTLRLGESIAEGFLTTILYQTPDWMLEAPCVTSTIDPITDIAKFQELCDDCPFKNGDCSIVADRLKIDENRTRGVLAGEIINRNRKKPVKKAGE